MKYGFINYLFIYHDTIVLNIEIRVTSNHILLTISWMIPLTNGTNSGNSKLPLPSLSSLLNAYLISSSEGLLSGGAPLVKSSIIFLTSGNSSIPDPSTSNCFITSRATIVSFAWSFNRACRATFGLFAPPCPCYAIYRIYACGKRFRKQSYFKYDKYLKPYI